MQTQLFTVRTGSRPVPAPDGTRGHGADHLLPVFVQPLLPLPVLDGRLQLGTWQSVVVVDPNVDNAERHIRRSWAAGS